VRTLGFTFTTSGTYVFFDAANPTLKTIINVLTAGQVCATGGTVVPVSARNLRSLGVYQVHSLNVSPSLLAAAAALISFMCITVMIAIFAHFKQYRARRAQGLFAVADTTEQRDNFTQLTVDSASALLTSICVICCVAP
jgi:hypothetical protein